MTRNSIRTSPTNTDPLLSIKEAAEYGRFSEGTIRRRIEAGQIPAVRFGARATRIRLSDLDTWLTSGDPS